ncbi:MAG: hypothetical protein ACREEK_32870 [Bradyrhizobium sp.]
MQRKEPVEKKTSLAWMPCPAKNILTRRANQRHISIIAPIVHPPMALPIGLSAQSQALPRVRSADLSMVSRLSSEVYRSIPDT